jgi:hypothetical protein
MRTRSKPPPAETLLICRMMDTVPMRSVNAPAGGSSAVLAGNVGECQFVYTAGALTERIGTVSIILQINSVSAGGGFERVRMFQQAQVSNAP